MEFGKLENVDSVDWTIPVDDPLSIQFLNSIQDSRAKLKIYFGAPAWGSKSWDGKIYPAKTKPSERLYFYSRYFTCIELNTTHYRIPTVDQIAKWRKQIPSDFIFCPKVFQGISHGRNGLLDGVLHQEWFRFLGELKENCGPCFLQLPPYFDYSFKSQLFHFLKNWPQEFELTLEFRHPSWFESGKIIPALTQYLQTKKIGLVITDVGGRRDVLHTSISADFTMLRVIGNELHTSDFIRARNWVLKFREWEIHGLRRVFLFIHEPEDILTPEMTQYYLEQIHNLLGHKVPRPFLLEEPMLGSLL